MQVRKADRQAQDCTFGRRVNSSARTSIPVQAVLAGVGELCQDTGLHRSQIMLIMKAKGIPEVFDKASFETMF